MLAPLGAYVQDMGESLDSTPRSFTVLAVVDADMLLVTTGVAFTIVLRRRIATPSSARGWWPSMRRW